MQKVFLNVQNKIEEKMKKLKLKEYKYNFILLY